MPPSLFDMASHLPLAIDYATYRHITPSLMPFRHHFCRYAFMLLILSLRYADYLRLSLLSERHYRHFC